MYRTGPVCSADARPLEEEMVAKNVRERVRTTRPTGTPEGVLETPRNLDDERIAGVVAGTVAETSGDVGEMVDIDCQDCRRLASHRRSRKRFLKEPAEEQSIRQSG